MGGPQVEIGEKHGLTNTPYLIRKILNVPNTCMHVYIENKQATEIQTNLWWHRRLSLHVRHPKAFSGK